MVRYVLQAFLVSQAANPFLPACSPSELWHVRFGTGDALMTLDELDTAFNAGRVDSDTLVRRYGSIRWITLREAAGLEDIEQAEQAERAHRTHRRRVTFAFALSLLVVGGGLATARYAPKLTNLVNARTAMRAPPPAPPAPAPPPKVEAVSTPTVVTPPTPKLKLAEAKKGKTHRPHKK
jgi:hypothetical protein